MKIVFVQTNYPGFLSSFYKKLGSDKNLNYEEIKKAWAKEFFGSADFYLKNLRPLGWSGDELILNDWVMQSKWMGEHGFKIKRSEIPLSNYIPQRIKNMLGMDGWMKQIFFKQVEFLKPDVIYIHDMTIFGNDDLKKLKKSVKLIIGQIAYPLPLNQSLLKDYDLIISSLPHYVRQFRTMGIKSEYLRWCFEGTIPGAIGKRQRIFNVSYVGGFTPHHSKGNKILESVAKKMDVNFWGYGENFLSPVSPIRKTFHGQAWGREMYEIFAKSKIVINRHINLAKNYANNMRMFDATGMGSLLITDAKSNMNEFFDVGKEVITYWNSDDLVDKIKYYLSHEAEREKIAAAGQRRTMKDHTYKERMKELNSILQKYLKQ